MASINYVDKQGGTTPQQAPFSSNFWVFKRETIVNIPVPPPTHKIPIYDVEINVLNFFYESLFRMPHLPQRAKVNMIPKI